MKSYKIAYSYYDIYERRLTTVAQFNIHDKKNILSIINYSITLSASTVYINSC